MPDTCKHLVGIATRRARMTQHQPPAAGRTAAQPGQTVTSPQRIEDKVSNRGPIAGSRETTVARPAQERTFSGLAVQNMVQNIDRSGDPGGWCHSVSCPEIVTTTFLPRLSQCD